MGTCGRRACVSATAPNEPAVLPSQIELLARDDTPGVHRSWGSRADSLRTEDGQTVHEGDQIRCDGGPSASLFDGTVERVLRPFDPGGKAQNTDWVLQARNLDGKRFILTPARSGGKLEVVGRGNWTGLQGPPDPPPPKLVFGSWWCSDAEGCWYRGVAGRRLGDPAPAAIAPETQATRTMLRLPRAGAWWSSWRRRSRDLRAS